MGMLLRMGRMRVRWIVVGVVVLALVLTILGINYQASSDQEIKVYVATNGNDSNDGSIDHPYLTFDKARLRARQIKAANPSTPISIVARGGTYYMTTPLNLTAADSGSAGAPITYASYPGEVAVITGSKTVTGFAPITDPAILSRLPAGAQANAKVVNLPSLGITNYGQLERRGGFLPIKPSGLTLSVNNQPMTLARYPNIGSWETVSSTADGTTSFVYTDPRPATWSDTNDIWLHGFFSHGWADSHLKIKSIDTNTKTIIVEGGFDSYGVRVKTNVNDQFGRYYYENVLSELDSIEEYFLDRATGNLIFWPPAGLASASVTVTIAGKLITGIGVSNVNFEQLHFNGSRANAISFTNSSFLKFSKIKISNTGNDSLLLTNVTDSIVASNTIEYSQERVIALSGGNRTTLVPSNNVIINNFLNQTAQWVMSDRQAIKIDGVGMKVVHNEISNNPQGAIRFTGNDHQIRYNNIHDILKDGADAGAIYSGRNYTYRGNDISYNYLKSIGNPITPNFSGTGIYLDDALSGTVIKGNIFDKIAHPFLIGGGRNNLVVGNLMIGNARPSVFDSRGLSWMRNKFYNAITAASNTSPIIISIAEPHGISFGVYLTAPKKVKVIGVEGNVAANGNWSYEVVSPNQLRLLDSTGNGEYTAGGDMYSPYANGDLYDHLNAVKNNPAYAKYSTLFNYSKYDLNHPVGNQFKNNIFYFGDRPAGPWMSMYASTPPYFNPENNIVHGSNGSPAIPPGNSIADPEFVDAANGNFQLKSTSPALAMGIPQPPPTSEMGKVSSDKLLMSLADQTTKVGQAVEVTAVSLYFATEQAQNPVFTTSDLPPGATFNPATRKFNWTPASDQVGVFNVTVTAEDDYLSTDRTFKITVTEADRGIGGSGGTGSGTSDSGSNNSGDFVLPPVQSTPNPILDAPGPVAAVKEVVKRKVATVINKEAVVASVATINSAVLDVLIAPITGQGTAKTTGRLIGILFVIVLPLVAAITIVILRRRARL